MSGFSKLVGLLCFAGIVAYWFFLPYQSYLALNNAGNLLGPIVANLLMFGLLVLVGLGVTTILGIFGFMLLVAD